MMLTVSLMPLVSLDLGSEKCNLPRNKKLFVAEIDISFLDKIQFQELRRQQFDYFLLFHNLLVVLPKITVYPILINIMCVKSYKSTRWQRFLTEPPVRGHSGG